MFIEIRHTHQRRLVGVSTTMSFASNTTVHLWRRFMPRQSEIAGRVSTEYLSVEVYAPDFFDVFNPTGLFEKWAAVEVNDGSMVPEAMDILIVPSGLYAVFLHQGPAENGPKTYEYIFREWLPHSGYRVDTRPHLAVMGDRYKHGAADSEEEILIPVALKV